MSSTITKTQIKKVKELTQTLWLGLGDTTQIETADIFSLRTQYDIENPHIYLLKMFRNPEMFPFTCKHLFNIDIFPFQNVILKELWYKKYPMLIGSRGMSKSFLLALYAMLKAVLCPGSKIIIVGAAFRQSKVIFDYCETIWERAPVLRSIFEGDRRDRSGPRRDVDRCTLTLGDSAIIAIPIGDGSKIRGLRASVIIADEFASISEEVYENVISGFSSVNLDPVSKAKQAAAARYLKELGLEQDNPVDGFVPDFGNQSILSGTAYYSFNHFHKYWQKYKAIIQSKGDKRILREIQGKEPEHLDWKAYSIIRIPYDLLPEGFMDIQHIERSQTTVHSGIFEMEFGAVFTGDSHGFFKRSLIESCVTKNPIATPGGNLAKFQAVIRGNPKGKYVYGIDPASESDNFAITILELHEDHRRVVYTWTTTRQAQQQRIKDGVTTELDYYGYCIRKIRDLMKIFPCSLMAIDSQGGGRAIIEGLHETRRLQPGENLLWPVIDPENPQPTDGYAGDHIIEVINFSKHEWVSDANHGLKKDLESKALLFPQFDSLSLLYSAEEDKVLERKYDTLEDCVMEIEDLKNELSTIVISQTSATMKEKWDTPEIKLPGGKKGRQRKDRYTALLMANAIAHKIQAPPPPIEAYQPAGGFIHLIAEKNNKQAYNDYGMYVGMLTPDMRKATAASANYGNIIVRKY